MVQAVRLETPTLPCWVPPAVFDAFEWCSSDWLTWTCPRGAFRDDTRIDGSDPERMVFVFQTPCEFLPRELAKVHAFGYGFEGEWALAPYAIDEATDELFARRVQPRSLLFLAADNLNALFWGLHDWAHFHNHGPFEEVAWTELQCDLMASHWLVANQQRIGTSTQRLTVLIHEVDQLASRRFAGHAGQAFAQRVIDEQLVVIRNAMSTH